MSACYLVHLTIKVKDKDGAAAALKRKIENGATEHTNYSLDKHKEESVGTDTLEDCIKIFLAHWVYNHQEVEVTEMGGSYSGFTTYTNGFNASYGWERTMIEMFEELAPYLCDRSYIKIYPDEDYDHYKITNGKCVLVH